MADSATFVSRRRNLELVGFKGRTFQKTHDSGHVETIRAPVIVFENGMLTTKDPELLEWLREHNLYNASEDGFYELEAAPPEPPDASDILGEIARLAARGDSESLGEILEVETQSWDRPHVTAAIRGALEVLASEPAISDAG